MIGCHSHIDTRTFLHLILHIFLFLHLELFFLLFVSSFRFFFSFLLYIDSPFRFDHARSIHVWYLMGLAHVDYLSLAKTGTMHQAMPMTVRSSGRGGSKRGGGKSTGGKGKIRIDSSSSSSTNLQQKFLKSTLNAQVRQKVNQGSGGGGGGGGGSGGSGTSPQRSRSLPSSPSSPYRPDSTLGGGSDGGSGGSGSGSGGSSEDGIKRSHSLNSRQKKNSPYKVKNITSAKLLATRLKLKAKRRSFHSIPRSKSPAVPQTI